nr:MAG TPA: hypothetical protein [Caudoviricetes sp.]
MLAGRNEAARSLLNAPYGNAKLVYTRMPYGLISSVYQIARSLISGISAPSQKRKYFLFPGITLKEKAVYSLIQKGDSSGVSLSYGE